MDEGALVEDGEIVEACDTSPAIDQFSLRSQATREPKTICSDESSDEKSEDSDDDSDAQCSKPKKVKPQPQLPVIRDQVPNKYKIWSITLQEEALTETLTKCDVEAIDRERSVESYNYKLVDRTDYSQYSGYHRPPSQFSYIEDDVRVKEEMEYSVGSKRRHSDIKMRLGHRKDPHRVRRLPHLTVTADDSEEEVAHDIAHKLREKKKDLILNVVLVLGKEKAITLYNETKVVEDNGGMLLMNGERRRTAGGVYLLLLKRDNSITSDKMKDIFSSDTRKKKKAARKEQRKKVEQLKETLIREKLLNLNTDAFIKSEEIKQETEESNNLEEGELTVTNPPPSPATDQGTPPSHGLALSEDEADQAARPTNPHRQVITYDDDDDHDYLDIEVDDMDVF